MEQLKERIPIAELKRCLLPFGAALLLGVGLHGLFGLWPSILTEFLAPVNESIWEHVKIIFWPLLLVEFAFYSKERRAGGLTAVLLCCAGMLIIAWSYHVVLGGRLLAVDLVLFAATIGAYFPLRRWLPVPRGSLSLLVGLYILAIGVLLAFTLTPPSGTLFNDPSLADAWVHLSC
ncbi:MAG: DUF6512 family protein [Clostridiales bacterium]|nr:DUF6512 family protein [Clostridiales bacterium]